MDRAVVLGFIGLVIIIITFIVILLDPVLTNGAPSGIGDRCDATDDCRSGLICSATDDTLATNTSGKTCVIPKDGSCGWNPTFCVGGTICYQGMCVDSLQVFPEPPPFTTPFKLMTPATQESDGLGDVILEDTEDPPIEIPAVGNGWFPGAAPFSAVQVQAEESLGSLNSGVSGNINPGFNVYAASEPDDPNAILITTGAAGAFYYNGYVYVIKVSNPTVIEVWTTQGIDGPYVYATLPLGIRFEGFLEVVGDEVYTIIDGVVMKSRISLNSFRFIVVQTDDPRRATYIAATPDGDQVFILRHPVNRDTYVVAAPTGYIEIGERDWKYKSQTRQVSGKKQGNFICNVDNQMVHTDCYHKSYTTKFSGGRKKNQFLIFR